MTSTTIHTKDNLWIQLRKWCLYGIIFNTPPVWNITLGRFMRFCCVARMTLFNWIVCGFYPNTIHKFVGLGLFSSKPHTRWHPPSISMSFPLGTLGLFIFLPVSTSWTGERLRTTRFVRDLPARGCGGGGRKQVFWRKLPTRGCGGGRREKSRKKPRKFQTTCFHAIDR